MSFDEDAFRHALGEFRSALVQAAAAHGSRALAAPAGRIGEQLTYRTETGSTNDDAAQAAKAGAASGSLFVSGSQTAGRGRRGASWVSAPDQNLLVSVLLRPQLTAESASPLTLAVGLAVRDAVANWVTEPVQIKWPNDIWIQRRKLAGILVESQLSQNRLESVVVGFGLNVGQREFPPELADTATSLALWATPTPSRERVLACVIAQLELRVSQFVRGGLAEMLDELRLHDGLLGRQLRAGGVAGVGRGIERTGALLVEGADGELFHVRHGGVDALD